MSTDSLYHLVKRIALAAGASLPDDALVHGLRHHFWVQLAIRGVSPATLQQLMGHTDPRTTALCTRHASRDLVNALDDAGWPCSALTSNVPTVGESFLRIVSTRSGVHVAFGHDNDVGRPERAGVLKRRDLAASTTTSTGVRPLIASSQ